MPELQLKTPKNQIMSLKEASSLYSEDEAFVIQAITPNIKPCFKLNQN